MKVVTDSSSDIAPELARELGITVVPLYVCFGEKVYRDRVDITEDEYYHQLITGLIHPTTSQPSPSDFAQVYEKLSEDTDEIVSIHASNKLSGTYNSALLAKESIGKKCCIEVIDSKWVTMALGLIAMGAARAAEDGEGLQQLVNRIMQAITQIRFLGSLDTLKYLAKGGRIGKSKSLLGTILNVKPLLTIRDGEIVPVGLVRTRNKAMERLIHFVKSGGHIQEVAIVHSTTAEDCRDLAERMASPFLDRAPYVSRLGPVIATHTGPGAVIVVFQEGEKEESGEAGDQPTKRRFSLPSLRLPRLTLSCSLLPGSG